MLIRTEGIGKVYATKAGPVEALAGLSIEVDAGRCAVIVGPSGSGKSTILNVLGGLASPTSGALFLDGTDVYSLSPTGRRRLRREKIGFVFQRFHLIPYLTAEENILMALALRQTDRPATTETAMSLLNRLGLGARATHLPDQLSVGEQQRVALARAIAGKPAIILADEPTGNLDPAAAENVCGYLRQFRDEGAAVVVVTHDPRLTSIADTTFTLKEGRLVA